MPAKTLYLAVGPHCWGRGETPQQAIARCRVNYPASLMKRIKGTNKPMPMSYNLYKGPEDLYVDEMGSVRWKEGKILKVREVLHDEDGKRHVKELNEELGGE